MEEEPARVLDIACGTGKAGILFAVRGCSVQGVESDERMAAVARRRGLDVDVSRFEQWRATRSFDLAICGQAWHWLDPQTRLERVADALRPGGRFAAFWNFPRFEPELGDEIDAVYAECAPELRAGRFGVGAHESERAADVEELEASALFGSVENWSFQREEHYSRDEWLDLLQTYSDHIALPGGQRARLLAAIGATIDAHGGTRTIEYHTLVVTARRT
jgi:SAM-dependent methyltransferase